MLKQELLRLHALKMDGVDDKLLAHSAILDLNLIASATLSNDLACFTVKSWKVHAFLDCWLGIQLNRISCLKFLKISGQAYLSPLSGVLFQLVSGFTAESADALNHDSFLPMRHSSKYLDHTKKKGGVYKDIYFWIWH